MHRQLMTSVWQSETTVISHLRVKSCGLDPLTAELRVASALSTTSLHPPALAPSAVLCIYKLSDPKPGSLSLQHSGTRPPPDWEQAAAAVIGRLARSAARPIREAVPANADAVLFADRAELLACLALDWLAGQTATRWWWRSLFRSVDIAQVVAPLWLDTPEYIPAALAHMAEQASVERFAQRLSDGEARALLRGITGSFGLPALQAALDTPLEDGAALEQGRDSFQPDLAKMPAPPPQPDRQPARSVVPPSTPWRRWAPESGEGALSIDRQCLVGIGLLLQRAPEVARAQSFAPAVARWRSAALVIEQASRFDMPAAAPPRPMVDRSDSRPTAFNSPPMPGVAATTTDQAAAAMPTAQASGSSAGESQPAPPSAQPGLAMAADDEALLDAWPESALGSSIGASLLDAWPESALGSSIGTPLLDAPPKALRPIEAQITTELGGLFYLLNLGLFLNLYGDFTTPAAPGIDLPIWDFVTLVGRRLLAGQSPDDPIWILLARLAGRAADETLGASFMPPDAWRLPPDWLIPFPQAGGWQYATDAGRLRVWHPAGFPLLDLPLESQADDAQLVREVAAYAGVAAYDLRPGPDRRETVERNTDGSVCDLPQGRAGDLRSPSRRLTEGGESTIDRWLGWLLPYVRARLCRALGPCAADELAQMLFAQRARVFVTAAHIDIVLALAELPIAIRLAGLDRDPGWVPAAGRFIAFHFE